MKGLLSTTLAILHTVFGAITRLLSHEAQSRLAEVVDRTDKTADWITYRVAATDTVSSESDEGKDFIVWITAEDELVCDFCGPLDHKIISIEQLTEWQYPPAHVNCRCRVEGVSDVYGREVPVGYYHEIPRDYDEWTDTGEGVVRPTRVEFNIDPLLLNYQVKLYKKIEKGWVTIEGRHIRFPDSGEIYVPNQMQVGAYRSKIPKSHYEGMKIQTVDKPNGDAIREAIREDYGPEMESMLSERDYELLNNGGAKYFPQSDRMVMGRQVEGKGPNLRDIFPHEVGHRAWHQQLSEDKRQDFYTMYREHGQDFTRLSQYAKEPDDTIRPSEAFAEGYRTFYQYPDVLRRTNPQIFQWYQNNLSE